MSAAPLTVHREVKKIADTYADSMVLLVATSVMSAQPGVSWAGAVMATPGALDDLAAQGFSLDVVLDEVVVALGAVELTAATPRRGAPEQTELHRLSL